MTRRTALLFVPLVALGSAAMAAPSCTSWLWQTGGWYWQQCVNDDGSRHCYRASDAKGSGAYEISCAG